MGAVFSNSEDAARTASSLRADASADTGAAAPRHDSAPEPEPPAKRSRREAELPADDSSASACSAAPIPHPLVSPPVNLAAVTEQMTALQSAVQLLITEKAELSAKVAAAEARAAAAEAGRAVAAAQAERAAAAAVAAEADRAAAAEIIALHEQARELEVTHPAVSALVQTHSQLWHAMSENGSSVQGQHWLRCLLGCPVQPQARCLELLSLLSQLQQAPDPPTYRIFHLLSKPLFDYLEGFSASELTDMLQVAEYLQLSKALVTRLEQHAAARELRLAHASPAALLAALQEGPLRLLLDARLAAIPNLFVASESREVFPYEDPDFDDHEDAVEEELELDDFASIIPRAEEQQQRLLADPCFLQGLCNAPCAWVSGCDGFYFKSIHLAGVVLAGHPLPLKLPLLTATPVAAAVAVGNFDAWKRMMAKDADLEKAALCAAAHFGQIEMLTWALDGDRGVYNSESVLASAAKSAAAAGQFAALRLLVDHDCGFDEKLTAAAARCDDLSMLQWLHAQGCPWDGSTLAQAAAGGHQQLLEWAIANYCPRDTRACAGAASAGNLPLLRWLRDQGFEWDVRCYIAAAEGGHLDVMRYARENGCGWGAGNAVCAAAARGGRLEILQWCVENGAAWGPRTCEGAAAGGHLDVLMYAHSNGCPMNERAACAAATHGHAACLAWIFENDGGSFKSPWIWEPAICLGHRECVKLSVLRGCADFTDPRTSRDWCAGAFGDLDLVRWLMDWAAGEGDDTCTDVADGICIGAAYYSHLHVLDWMLSAEHLNLDCSAPAVEALDSSVDSFQTLKWLHAHDVRLHASVFEKAAALADIEVLTWLRDVAHCPWDSRACVAAAKRRYGSLEPLQWLVQAGCPLSAAVWDAAVDFDARKWLCMLPSRPWNSKLVLWALRKGDKATANWALANEPDAAAVVSAHGCATAISSGHLAMVAWARKHGGKWNGACAKALASAKLEMVLCCKSHGFIVGEALAARLRARGYGYYW